MREDDWLDWISAVISCEHVDLSLIQTQLANIGFQKEDVSTLHTRVENLGRWEIISFASSHDGTALLDSSNVVLPTDVHDKTPVLVSSSIDFVGSPEELDVAEVHTGSFPDLNEISSDSLDFV